MACLEAYPWPTMLPFVITGPPLRGDLISLHHGFEIAADSQEDDYYVHEGPWDELIWEDSERDFNRSPAFVYSLAHARVNSWAMVFMSAWTAVIHNSFCMFLIVMQWICHCVQWYIDSVGVFVWALARFLGFVVFLLFASLFPLAKRKSGWGFAGRRFLFGCGFRFCCFNRFADSKDFCPCTVYLLLTLM